MVGAGGDGVGGGGWSWVVGGWAFRHQLPDIQTHKQNAETKEDGLIILQVDS